jgi:hypothetical protein
MYDDSDKKYSLMLGDFNCAIQKNLDRNPPHSQTPWVTHTTIKESYCHPHSFSIHFAIESNHLLLSEFLVNKLRQFFFYFIFMLYTLFVNATVCKHYKVKILKMNGNRTNVVKLYFVFLFSDIFTIMTFSRPSMLASSNRLSLFSTSSML